MLMMERLIASMTPLCCLSCHSEGQLICEDCQPLVCQPVPPRCYRCRRTTDQFKTCSSCRSSSNLRRVLVRTELTGVAKQLLFLYKFERLQSGSDLIASYMQQVLMTESNYIIVPVPTATSRLRERGYNHTSLLAKYLARKLRYRVLPVAVRLTQSRQVGSKRELRLNQLAEAFRVYESLSLVGASILLVDDVVTTGATLEAIAICLKSAGAKTVDAVVFAQK